MTFSTSTPNIMAVSIMTLCHYAECQVFYCYAECHCAECHYAECPYALWGFVTVMYFVKNLTRYDCWNLGLTLVSNWVSAVWVSISTKLVLFIVMVFLKNILNRFLMSSDLVLNFRSFGFKFEKTKIIGLCVRVLKFVKYLLVFNQANYDIKMTQNGTEQYEFSVLTRQDQFWKSTSFNEWVQDCLNLV